MVASGDSQRGLFVWDAASKEKRGTHGGHKNAVIAVAFTPDGTGVASVSSDKSLVVYDIASKKDFKV